MKKENSIELAKKMAKSKPNSKQYFKYFKKYCLANGWTNSNVNGYSVLEENFESVVSQEVKEEGRMLWTQ